MIMEANEIDDILQGLGVSSSPTPPSQSSEESLENEMYSEDDINDILSDNGIPIGNGEDPEENEEVSEREAAEAEAVPAQENLSETEESTNVAVEEHLENQHTDTHNEAPQAETIPLNSPTLLLDDSTSRFSGTEWYSEIQKARILIGGCGGIGSNLIFQLARMKPANITIYDDDTVEAVNLAGQLFSITDMGKAKVNAMADMVLNYTTMNQVHAIQEKFTLITEPGDIMMCGFDNMVARRRFFKSWRDHVISKPVGERAKCLYLDGRLSIDTLQILCIKGNDLYNMERYEREFLFSDSQADETVCSMKQTTYLACMIGSLMTNLFTNFIAGTLDPVIPYDLPFFTEYDAQNMIFKTEN